MKRIPWLLLVLLSGCAEPFGSGPRQSVGQSYSLDAVKRISPSITAGDAVETYGQGTYEVGPASRLLLRYENFSQHTSYVDVEADPAKNKRMWVYLTVDGDAGVARAQVKLCPLVVSWMMLATWRYYHPFAGGKWKADGGDYEATACQSAVALSTTPDPTEKPQLLRFDMTDWFIDYLRGRNLNHGWIAVSDTAVRVVGETSPSLSPRVLFDKYLGH